MVSEFLSEAWLEELGACGLDAGPSVGDAVLRVDVAGAPAGRASWTARFAAGRLTSASPGAPADADVVLSIPWADAVAVLRGELGVNAAYMQGRLKTDGPTGPLLGVLAALSSPAGVACREALSATTGT